jgi:hypothetical protein
MKARQTMSHNELINETTRQLSSRFQPDANLIKRRIEGLIEVYFTLVPSRLILFPPFAHDCSNSAIIWNVRRIASHTDIW